MKTKRKDLHFVIQDDKAIRVAPGDLKPVGKGFRQFAAVDVDGERVVARVVRADDMKGAARTAKSRFLGLPVGRNGKGVVFRLTEITD